MFYSSTALCIINEDKKFAHKPVEHLSLSSSYCIKTNYLIHLIIKLIDIKINHLVEMYDKNKAYVKGFK